MKVILFMLSFYSAATANFINRGISEKCGTKCIYEAAKGGHYCNTANGPMKCTIPNSGENLECSEYIIPSSEPTYQHPYIHFEGNLTIPLEAGEYLSPGSGGYKVVIETTLAVIQQCEFSHPNEGTCVGTHVTISSTESFTGLSAGNLELPFKIDYYDPRVYVSTIRINKKLICGGEEEQEYKEEEEEVRNTSNSINWELSEKCTTKCIYEAEKGGHYCGSATGPMKCTIPNSGENLECSEFIIPSSEPTYQHPYIHFEGNLTIPLEAGEYLSPGRGGYAVVIETTNPVIQKCEVSLPNMGTCSGSYLTVYSAKSFPGLSVGNLVIPFKIDYRDPRVYVSTIHINERLVCGKTTKSTTTLSEFKKKYDNELSRYDNELSQYDKELYQYDNELSRYDNELSQYDNELSRYDNELSQYDNELSQYDNELSGYDNKLSLYDNELSQYGEAEVFGDVLPVETICVTDSGASPHKPCIFPFKFKGVVYNECTWESAHLTEHKPWCSTLVDGTGHHVGGQGKWGNCGPGCPIPTVNRR